MSWFEKIFGSKPKVQKASSVPFLHELYRFDPLEEGYILWTNSENHKALKDLIFYAFAKFKNDTISHSGMHFMSDHKVNAIAIDCHKFDYTKKDYLFLITYIIECLKEKGYILNLADIRSEQINNDLNQTIRAYLKPSRKLVEGSKAIQLFGNINLELVSIDERQKQFKLVSTIYSDQNFHEAMDFRLLINQIFKNE